METKTSLKCETSLAAKPYLVHCAYTGRPAQYRIGVVEYNKKRVVKDVGAVVEQKVLHAIESLLNHFFGTRYWPVVMDLDGNILFRGDDAEKKKISVKEGWREYLFQHSP